MGNEVAFQADAAFAKPEIYVRRIESLPLPGR
jgi:hypothetical protein